MSYICEINPCISVYLGPSQCRICTVSILICHISCKRKQGWSLLHDLLLKQNWFLQPSALIVVGYLLEVLDLWGAFCSECYPRAFLKNGSVQPGWMGRPKQWGFILELERSGSAGLCSTCDMQSLESPSGITAPSSLRNECITRGLLTPRVLQHLCTRARPLALHPWQMMPLSNLRSGREKVISYFLYFSTRGGLLLLNPGSSFPLADCTGGGTASVLLTPSPEGKLSPGLGFSCREEVWTEGTEERNGSFILVG